jgi:hypothetical protein
VIALAIRAVQRAGDGVRWTAVRLARLHSWLLELQREEDADCARDVWPGMPRERTATVCVDPDERFDLRDMRGVTYHTRGSAVDTASRSLAGYDERPAHCVVCGLACGASRCEWCARAEATS